MSTGILETVAILKPQVVEPAEVTDLRRGESARLLERLGRLVVERNVTLDLSSVERIDAAGISALLALYCRARESGNRFSLVNVSARVAEILRVVGLDRLFLSHNPVQKSQYGKGLCRSAA